MDRGAYAASDAQNNLEPGYAGCLIDWSMKKVAAWRQNMAIDTEAIKEHVRGILAALGDNPDREGLKKRLTG